MSTWAKVAAWLALIALAAGLYFVIVHAYEHWRDSVRAEGEQAGAARVQAAWNEDIKKRDAETLRRVEAARAEGAQMAASAAAGELHAMQQAKARAEQQAAAARRAASAAGGVRDTIAALDRSARALGIPDAASCPGEFAKQRDDAIRARAVFGACVSAYQVLADRADRDRGDLQLRLDTALSWIRSTGAPGADELPAAP